MASGSTPGRSWRRHNATRRAFLCSGATQPVNPKFAPYADDLREEAIAGLRCALESHVSAATLEWANPGHVRLPDRGGPDLAGVR